MIGNTTYGNGSVTTQTSIDPYPSANNGGLLNFARQMMTLKARRPTVQPVAAPPQQVLAPEPRQKSELEKLQERDQILQMKARQNGPPLTMTYPYGSAGFLTMDPNKMNAYQRAAYLPGSSSQSGGFGPGAVASIEDDGPMLAGGTNIGADPTEKYKRAMQTRGESDQDRRALLYDGGERR